VNLPVFVRDEGPDFALPVDDQPHRDGLDPSRAQPPGDLLPEQGRNLVTDYSVEDSARLLSIHSIHVDGSRIVEGVFDLGPRDGTENHALCSLWIDPEDFREMPGNRLALAVEIRCEPDLAGLPGGLPELRDRGFLVREHLVVRFEVPVERDGGNRALVALGLLPGQVADMAYAGEDHVVVAEVLVDRAGLRRALDDDELLVRGIDFLSSGTGLLAARTAFLRHVAPDGGSRAGPLRSGARRRAAENNRHPALSRRRLYGGQTRSGGSGNIPAFATVIAPGAQGPGGVHEPGRPARIQRVRRRWAGPPVPCGRADRWMSESSPAARMS